MSLSKEQLCDELSEMKVIDLLELSKILQDKWGVTPMAAAAPAVSGGGAPAAAAEEQTEFSVYLTGCEGSKKIQVIKEIRNIISGLSLGDAKALVEGASASDPQPVLECVDKAKSEECKKSLEAAGGAVDIK